MLRALALLAVLALMPGPAAAVGVPAGVPGMCEGTCPVPGSGITGFVPPVLVLRSGSTVAWQSMDIGHLNLEDAVGQPSDGCFDAFYTTGVDALVTFRVVDGGLVAEQDGVPKACASATAVGGAQVLTYYCRIHSFTMKGALVVVA
ncbi:MAG: hypothetical protein LC624_05230 [Halobacteriales archaeon]|nr:hypothetical protein [Halobacteriales archaeon]